MKEKFSDYESLGFLNKEGSYVFKITSYELKDSKNGSLMAVFEVESKTAGKATIYHSLSPKARWSYNNLIKACLQLTPAEIKDFEFDYETDGQTLVGKFFIGDVTQETYTKAVKKPLDDGTFEDAEETKVSYKITAYHSTKEADDYDVSADDLPW